MKKNPIVDALAKAVKGLQYVSETEAPLEPFLWEGNEEMDEKRVLKLAGAAKLILRSPRRPRQPPQLSLGVRNRLSTRESNMSIRPVQRLVRAKPAVEGAGVHLRRAFGFGNTADHLYLPMATVRAMFAQAAASPPDVVK